MSVHLACDPHGLVGGVLGHDLVGALCPLGEAVPDEERVSHSHQDVVDAVELDALDAPLLHVRQDPVLAEGAVEAPVAVGGAGEVGLGGQDDLALEGEAREGALLEDNHVLRLQAEVVVVPEEVGGGLDRAGGGHNVPQDLA